MDKLKIWIEVSQLTSYFRLIQRQLQFCFKICNICPLIRRHFYQLLTNLLLPFLYEDKINKMFQSTIDHYKCLCKERKCWSKQNFFFYRKIFSNFLQRDFKNHYRLLTTQLFWNRSLTLIDQSDKTFILFVYGMN